MYEKSFFVLLTNQCNLSCRHCYNMLDPIKAHSALHGKNQLTVEQLSHLFSELVNQGYEKVLFSGGEALLRSDTPEIIKEARTKGLRTALFTNGHTLTEGIIKHLGDAGLNEIRISLNEMVWCRNREQYEKIFSAQTRWLHELQTIGISVGFIFIISKYNIDYVSETYDRLLALGSSMKIQPLYLPKHFDEFTEIAAPSIPAAKWEELMVSFDKKHNNAVFKDQSTPDSVYGATEEIIRYIQLLQHTYRTGKQPNFCPTGPLLVVDAEGWFHPCLFRHDIVCGHISKDESIITIDERLKQYAYLSEATCYQEECLSAFR